MGIVLETEKQGRVLQTEFFGGVQGVRLLQLLAQGLHEAQVRDEMGLSGNEFANLVEEIIKNFGGKNESKPRKLWRAIVIGVEENKVDTSRLPGLPQEPLSSVERKLLVSMQFGLPKDIAMEFFGIREDCFHGYLADLAKKVGVRTSCALVAWGMKHRSALGFSNDISKEEAQKLLSGKRMA